MSWYWSINRLLHMFLLLCDITITATSNDCHDILNNWSIKCLFNSLFWLTTNGHQRSALLSLCKQNPPVISWFPTQMDSQAENVSTWWHHNESTALSFCHKTMIHPLYHAVETPYSMIPYNTKFYIHYRPMALIICKHLIRPQACY